MIYMTPFDHVKAQLKMAQHNDADIVKVNIEELASIMGDLQEHKDEAFISGYEYARNEIYNIIKGILGDEKANELIMLINQSIPE